jgi:murein L,D-transpeptidase YafK
MQRRRAFRLLATSAALAALAAVPAASNNAVVSDAGPEAMLARVYGEIERKQLDAALDRTEALLRAYPNFRLAHLIRGDLLLARAQPLAAFGSAPNAPADKLADLREEALARLGGYRTKPPADFVPRYLLQMHAAQRYAIVVDTRKSRLYVYENRDGKPRFVADYYASHGKAGTEKRREGDKKTPLGVYYVTASLPRDKLPDFYGSGAYPINYPNEWDRRQGREGHGIWLHGTPSDTFSRPPRASDGCVVLANQDLDKLAANLQVGLTPVIISNDVEWLSLDDWESERAALRSQFEEWRRDWESRDVERYLRHYARQFQSTDQNLEQWAAQKRKVAAGKAWIKVAASNVSMFRNPGEDDMVVVTFDQDYRSNNLNNSMRKRQYWIKDAGRWKIVHEGSA